MPIIVLCVLGQFAACFCFMKTQKNVPFSHNWNVTPFTHADRRLPSVSRRVRPGHQVAAWEVERVGRMNEKWERNEKATHMLGIITCWRGCMRAKLGWFFSLFVIARERKRETERLFLADRQDNDRQTAEVARIGVIGVCLCVYVCHKACYGPWSGIGWPQLSWSHWRRFHKRCVRHYSAILPGPRGAPASVLSQTFAHTQTHNHTTTHTHTNTFESTTNSHIHTKMHTAWLWNHTHQHTPSNRHFSLRCTVLIDSTWQSLSAGREVRSGGKEKHIGVVSMCKLKDASHQKRKSKSLFSGFLVSSNMVQ